MSGVRRGGGATPRASNGAGEDAADRPAAACPLTRIRGSAEYTRALRRARFACLLLTLLPLFAAAQPAHAAPTPAQQLVARYAPILEVRKQENPPCDESEEQYEPTTVNAVLGNPLVVLQHIQGKNKRAITNAPTAAQIAGLDDTYFLNLPGDPITNDCGYARDFAALKKAGKAPAVTYARLAGEAGTNGLVVQYWFFWYFNQFNDVHEGDWEGMQITFDGTTPQEALRNGPDQIGLFQHGGGETADWDDERVQKEGTHPVVYPAAGSHATFFSSAVWLQTGRAAPGWAATTPPSRCGGSCPGPSSSRPTRSRAAPTSG